MALINLNLKLEFCAAASFSLLLILPDQVEVVTRLMEVEAIWRQQSSLASCLMCACKRGHVASVRRLVTEARMPLDIPNKAGLAPINLTEDTEIRDIIQAEARR